MELARVRCLKKGWVSSLATRSAIRRSLQTNVHPTSFRTFEPSFTSPNSKESGSKSSVSGGDPKAPKKSLLWNKHAMTDVFSELNRQDEKKTTQSLNDMLSSIGSSFAPKASASREAGKVTPTRPTQQSNTAQTSGGETAWRASSTATESVDKLEPQTKTRAPRKFKPRKAAITLTKNAVAHVQNLLEGPEPKLLRIGVRNRGCSGLTYHFEYVDKPGMFDEEVVQDGVKVLVDSKALFSIIGSEMDWVDDKLSNRFVFRNPNIKGSCGCGESFMV
ncbi:uncharacterized protein V1510DRAFT_426381 [Dipodascopsis tothii]|uniref:uncharacterized protein n=1 Tax=Dipodascopsis tothii TaxID=44089 RepID=UPI0034CF37E6